ncbi:MAG TPA: histidine kinase [Candidatus Pelethocola excrementipullorum]|nr:histidine kinase [Candidatus Pelethocola excrementipullorum]
MRQRKYGKQKNISQWSRTIFKLGIPLMIIFCLLSGIILNNIKKQNVEYMHGMFSLYVDELNDRFFRISRRILLLMMDNDYESNVEAIKENEDEVASYYAVNKLREDMLPFRWEYGPEYQFFLYFKDSDYFVNLGINDNLKISEESRDTLIQQMVSDGEYTYSIKRKWKNLNVQEGNYVYKIGYKDGVYTGCIVNIEDLLSSFQQLELGEKGYVELIESDGELLDRLGKGEGKGFASSDSHWLWEPDTIITESLKWAPFSISIRIANSYEQNIWLGVALLLLCLALLLLLSFVSMVLYLRYYVLKPIEKFVSNLQKYDDNDFIYNISPNYILEFEQADEQFRKMFHQIKKLKFTLYEQELEKRSVEMNYLKMQIRPHFYLNCLNFVYSMIDFGHYEDAKKMAKTTAGYLQYIFRNSEDQVLISEELRHCKNYLDILKMRYNDALDYYFEQDASTKMVEIFPFFIQTFVENAVKHALTLDKKVLISVTVFPELIDGEDYVNIYISDTGRGFEEGVLEKLKNHESLETSSGKHLGINNCLKRLAYLYGDKAIVRFDNSPLGGAIIDIHIPMKSGGVLE